ncbi:hypothetical protein ACFLJF_005383 [Salmonella enterica]
MITDGDRNLELQYEEAYETLADLAERFFYGDREKIVDSGCTGQSRHKHATYYSYYEAFGSPSPNDNKRQILIQ